MAPGRGRPGSGDGEEAVRGGAAAAGGVAGGDLLGGGVRRPALTSAPAGAGPRRPLAAPTGSGSVQSGAIGSSKATWMWSWWSPSVK